MRIGLAVAGVGAFALAALAALTPACSNQAKPVGLGGQCFQAIDCADGLVCVPQADGRSSCTNDVSGIVHIEDAAAPRDAVVLDGMTDGRPGDATPSDGNPPADTGVPVEAATD